MKNKERYLISNQQTLAVCLSNIAETVAQQPDKTIEVVFGLYQKQRTDLQNKLLNGHVFRGQLMPKLNDAGLGITDDETGEYFSWDVELLRAYFKAPYFQDTVTGKSYITKNGKEFRKDFHPSGLSTADFSKYVNLIYDFSAMKWGIYIDPPRSDMELIQMFKDVRCQK